jgi:hypothetical protein
MIKGFRNVIIDLSDVRKLADQYNQFEAFTSMYLYTDDILRYIQSNKIEGKTSISGYDGLIHSNYIFFNINLKDLGKGDGNCKNNKERMNL